MKKTAFVLVAAVLLSLSLVLMTGCSDDDEVTAPATVAQKPFVSAVVGLDNHRKAESRSGAYVSVSNFTTCPGVTVNGTELMIEPEFSVYSGGMGFVGDFAQGIDNQVNLEVRFGEGEDTATGTINMPGENEVVGASDIDITAFQRLDLAWTTASNAEAYLVSGYFNCRYTDNSDESQDFDIRFSYTTTDTMMTFLPAEIWPAAADVQSMDNFWGDVDVMPVVGPLTPGSAANITGACNGVLVSFGYDLDWDFNFNSNPVIKADPVPDTSPDWTAIVMEQLAR